MDIPLSYIITSIVCLIIGLTVGYFVSSKIHRNRSLTRALRYKNPEAWEIAHCIIAEEDQEKKEKTDSIKQKVANRKSI